MEEMEDIHLDAGINIDTVALSRAVTKLGYCRDELLRCCEDLFANPNRFDLNPDTVDDLKRADKGLKNALKGHYEAFRDLGIAIDKLRFPPLSTDGNPGQKTAEQVRNYGRSGWMHPCCVLYRLSGFGSPLPWFLQSLLQEW